MIVDKSKYKDYDKGIYEYFNDNYVEAIEYFNKALEEAKKVNDKKAMVIFYYYIAIFKDNLKQYEEAIKDFDKVIELDSEFKQAYCSRGDAKFKLGRYEEAIEDYDKAIEINGKLITISNDICYCSRGNANFELGKYEEAIKDYDKAIDLDSEYINVYYRRGKVKAKLGRYREAIEDYVKVAELDSECAKVFNLYNEIIDLVRLIEESK